MIFARLSRIVPLLIVLAVVAVIVYLIVAWRHSPNRGKEVLIKSFTVVMGALSAFFLLVCLYALFEQNEPVLDLAVSFLLTTLIGLIITRVCRAVFVHHHPKYRFKAAKTERSDTRTRRRPPWK